MFFVIHGTGVVKVTDKTAKLVTGALKEKPKTQNLKPRT